MHIIGMFQGISFIRVLKFLGRLMLLNAAVLALMTMFRLFFGFYFGDLSALSVQPVDVARAFLLGFRYDLAIVAYINSIVTVSFIIVWLLSSETLFRKWQKCVRWYLFVMFSLMFVIMCVDFGFFSYFKNHINILIFGVVEDDTRALFSTLHANYNLYLAGAGFAVLILFIFFLVFRVMRLKGPPQLMDAYQIMVHTNTRVNGWGKAGIIAGLLALNFAAARGSFALFPLGVMDAEISRDIFINKLSLNGIFTLQEAIEFRMNENKDYDVSAMTGYAGDMRRAVGDYLGVNPAGIDGDLQQHLIRRTAVNPVLERLKPNVIVIMMEGFGTDLLQYQSPTFNVMGALKKHFDEDTVFYNFLSGDVGTIGSLEAVVTSLPKRPMAKPLTQTRRAFNVYQFGAALPYRTAGYDTMFLYGGTIGWRNVLSFLPRMGFQEAVGSGAMPSAYERNEWGVYDEYLFDYIFRKLSDTTSGRSKFIFALTTSNHPPYALPSNYTLLPLTPSAAMDQLITGDRALARGRFETYQYACQKLGEFLTRLKESPYGRNTIVAVTGDHNFWSVFDYNADRYLDMDSVPFYLYLPPALRKGSVNTRVFGSHVDVMPTLFNASLSGARYLALGYDLLNPSQPHIAFNVDGLIMDTDAAARHIVDKKTTQYYVWQSSPTPARLLAPAARQAAHDRLVKHYTAAISIADYLIKETGK